MALCLDASAAVEAILPRPERPHVRRFLLNRLSEGDQLVAPPLLFAEVTSVLRRHVHLGKLEHQEAVIAIQDLFTLPVRVVHQPIVYLRALEFARRVGHARAYDVQYLAVAEMEHCPLVTLDRGLYESALTLGVSAHLLP